MKLIEFATQRSPVVVLFIALLHLFNVPTAIAGELHKAARTGDLATVTALIDTGSDVNETDGEGETALHKAAKFGHGEVVLALLAAGVDPLIRGHSEFGSSGTALHMAAKFGRIDSLKVLLENGADPNLGDSAVGTPLHLAVRYRRAEAADLLRSFGAGPVAEQPINSLIAVSDPAIGKDAANTCQLCHQMGQTQGEGMPPQGPLLWDIVGRAKASVEGYSYSTSMKEAGGTWSYEDLNSFMSEPRAFIPGTKMDTFQGIRSPERRAALIRYLRDLSDTPAALPE